MSDYEKFKESVNSTAKHWVNISEATLNHEILKGKRKNDNFTRIRSHGRPPNVKFELCPKPRKKCLLRSVTDGTLFCMAEEPCWRQLK